MSDHLIICGLAWIIGWQFADTLKINRIKELLEQRK